MQYEVDNTQDPKDGVDQPQTPMESSTDVSVETGSSGGVGSWLGGGLSDLAGLARTIKNSIPPALDGIAVAIHRSAMNVAAEFSEMEREAEVEARRWREEHGGEREETEGASEEEEISVLPLPWECSSGTDDDESQAGDEELKVKILGLSLEESTFKEPFDAQNSDDSEEMDHYLDNARVHLIRRLLERDENLGRMHAKLSGRSDTKETLFWKNYFHHCDMLRAEHEVGAELIDVPTTCDIDGSSRPPTPTPASGNQNVAQTETSASPPRVLSVGEFVLVDCEDDNLDQLANEMARDSL
uniref:BSD domain-containing protein n=1 Tax=Trieres chinensis TaxID=1514140 RepID=A0A7S1YWV0_TRICV|mmetsp:Transcript_12507/g.25983  ORF Transcript_12507/g.25983 Transcript_12507/m.25983 type:complete len:299 (+) Transcript_12507:119-1015(+)